MNNIRTAAALVRFGVEIPTGRKCAVARTRTRCSLDISLKRDLGGVVKKKRKKGQKDMYKKRNTVKCSQKQTNKTMKQNNATALLMFV